MILSDGNVLLDAEGPIDVQDVLVERQHEHDQHKQRVEDGKEKDGLVAQLLQTRGQFGLKKNGRILVWKKGGCTSWVSPLKVMFSFTPKGQSR